MKSAAAQTTSAKATVVRLNAFIAKFDAKDQRLIRAIRLAMRKRLPTANELVYDNYNFFVIGYSPTERPSDAILSIAARAGSVSVYFLHGARLPDRAKLLQGAGNRGRFVRVTSASELAHPAVAALISAAVAHTKAPFPIKGRGKLIIRSVSAKQRPRRAITLHSPSKKLHREDVKMGRA